MEINVHTNYGYKKLGQFLIENDQTFLHFWEEEIIVHENIDNKELIRKNGFLMYQIIANFCDGIY